MPCGRHRTPLAEHARSLREEPADVELDMAFPMYVVSLQNVLQLSFCCRNQDFPSCPSDFRNQPNLSWSDPKKSLKIMIAQVGPLILILDGWWAKGYLYKKHLLLTALGHTPTEEHDRGQAP